MKLSYPFASYCKKLAPGKHTGKFVSDLDIENSKYMFLHRKLRYHLYPTIDLKFNRDKPIDYIVVFFKENPEKAVPKNFEIIGKYNKYCLLAKRKK